MTGIAVPSDHAAFEKSPGKTNLHFVIFYIT
uniref:Uncharacterized protein n=1 Tax=Anguilla anguilla TaxID=7936 RepID=A0A0E9XB95_ANGAN